MIKKALHHLVSSAVSRLIVVSAAALLCGNMPSANAETFVTTGGTLSWTNNPSWVEGTVPNAIGATAIFNTPLANQSASLVGSTVGGGITVGSITFNSTGTFTMGIPNGTGGGPLIFDEVGAGPATITTTGGGSGNSTISATLVFTDSVRIIANNTVASAGVTLSGAITGSGGIIKEGDGIATISTANKAYTGATVLNAGRLRLSLAGLPTATSSFTINSGAQLTLISAGTYTLGNGPLNLNGTGAVTGPFAVFPGAIRNDTGLAVTNNNATVLQSDTLLHVEGSASGSLTFANSISGVGKLTLTAPNSSANQGQLVLNGNNSYQGGTLVRGGTLVVSGASATLGTGNVTVDNTGSLSSIAKLSLASGVLNAIADGATLLLAGGGTVGVADQGFADLGAGINELVGGLTLGSTQQAAGTYGSSLSGAAFQLDEYFAGTGIITVVPEPSVLALATVGGLMALFLRRRKR